MNKVKSIIGLSALCALAFSAFSAAGASAAGWTAYTCKAGTGGTSADCELGSSGTAGFVSFAASTPTDLSVNAAAPTVLETEAFGIPLELEAGSVEAVRGSIINSESGGTTGVSGEVELTFGEVALVQPAGFGCEVEAGMITSGTLSLSTNASGEVIMPLPMSGRYWIVHIVNCILAGNYPTTGNWQAPTNGATMETDAEEFEFNGEPATLQADLTFSGKDTSISEDSYKPLAFSETGTEPSPPEGITAFACAKGAGKKDFGDPHCDEAKTGGTGEYGHEAIATGKATEIELTNEATEDDTTDSADAVLEASIVGVEAKVTATKVRGSGSVENYEPKKGVAQVKGEATLEFSKLHVDKPPGCVVSEPVKAVATLASVADGADMGIELKPKSGTTFLDLTFEGKECALDGITAHVKGTATATGGAGGCAEGSGATAVFVPALESLYVGPGGASLTSTITWRMKEGPPIAFTTVN